MRNIVRLRELAKISNAPAAEVLFVEKLSDFSDINQEYRIITIIN